MTEQQGPVLSKEYFSASHPLAEVVRHRCKAEHGIGHSYGRPGCVQCWEWAIRADERTAIGEQLGPVTLDDDPEINWQRVADYLIGRRVTPNRAERMQIIHAWMTRDPRLTAATVQKRTGWPARSCRELFRDAAARIREADAEPAPRTLIVARPSGQVSTSRKGAA